MNHRPVSRLVLAAFGVAVVACRDQASPADFAGKELTSSQLLAATTNAVADDPVAAELGQQVFFDRGLSSDGTVACIDCHDPANGFSDPKARSVGVRGQRGDRHAMPVTAAVFHPFLLWDGKADSPWLQPLKAIENPKEMDFTRVEVAHRAVTVYGAKYEAVFGPLPDLTAAPARALPGDAEWDGMSKSLQDDVQRVFTNMGKAVEAYERKLLCTDTKFDRWQRGEVQLSGDELAGADTFNREHCNRCHSGPSFSDGEFHDIGLPSSDLGRELGVPALLSDPLNAAGEYSDDPEAGAAKLMAVATETATEGAFRTASLRGVGQRTFFGHAAHEQTPRGFILDVYRRGGRRGGGGGGRGGATVGVLDPKLDDVNVDGDDVNDLIAFLHTLDCPAPSADLLVH
jgi:cytochrome c peroxidase